MGLPVIILYFFFLSLLGYCYAEDQVSTSTPNRVLFLMQRGQCDAALELYINYSKQLGHHDPEVLQQVGLAILDQGWRTRDPETQLLTLFGAGISLNEKTLRILEEGIKSSVPELQFVSIGFLSRYQNDQADSALNRALSSNSLLVRLEGLLQLAKRKAPTALGQIESLRSKVPSEIHPIFPQLYAMLGTPEAIRALRRLLVDTNEMVCVEAVMSAAKTGRDDLLPSIRLLATHTRGAQQEACAFALGVFEDSSSIEKLRKLAASSTVTVRLAALQALYSLGVQEAYDAIEEHARAEDLFAIALLGDVTKSAYTLYLLSQSQNVQVRVNAALALLKQRDPRCLSVLIDLLIRDSRDLALSKITSPAGSLEAYKVIPSAQQNLHDAGASLELSLCLREEVLKQTMELPEGDFLNLARNLFREQQGDLIPALVECLETVQTPAAIALLKQQQQKAGAPLIRTYCTLALFRLKEEGPYEDQLQAWVKSQQDEELIRFRPIVARKGRDEETSYQLTPKETSRLLVECFEALAIQQEEIGITILLEAIRNGNKLNKYALAGLLMRAVQ